MSSSQEYRSTRSATPQAISFEEAVITGLAKDGGLFIPSVIPKLPSNFLTEWSNFSFQELAFNIIRLYVKESEISNEELKTLVSKSYSTFRSDEITPIHKLKDDLYLLELFHGPTYAFKDVALQFVGNLFEFFLTRKNAAKKEGEPRDFITVVGATSGDTGSAAIYGLRNKKDVSVFIMFPTGRVSPIQELQMTTVTDKNVHNLSVKGSFDDCQDIVKKIFADVEFNDKYHVGAVNSINWARILAQISYYFHSYFQLIKENPNAKVKFVVPSGNFGDILAGFFAREMGLPIEELVIATNENDILNRFLNTGVYNKTPAHATYSPAMDISIASNFERLLWYVIRDTDGENDDNKSGEILNSLMKDLTTTGSFTVSKELITKTRSIFDSFKVTNEETVDTIKSIYQSNKYIADPHTAVGIKASLTKSSQENGFTYISLSTAHPAKFSEVVNKALNGFESYDFENQVLPQQFKDFVKLEKNVVIIDKPDVSLVERVIVEELKKESE